MRPDEESLCADARKLPLKGRDAGVPKTVFGVQEMAARGSPAAHQLGNAGGSAIGRAILFHSAQGHGQPLADSSLGCDFGRGSSRSEARAEAGAMCATLEPHASDGVVNSHIPPAPSMSPPAAVRPVRRVIHTG